MKFTEEIYGLMWGTLLLVIGLIILLIVLTNVLAIAQNPNEKLNEWVPEEIKEPTAAFEWWSNDTNVEFNDLSLEGSEEISSWSWDFDEDGNEDSYLQDPSHTYSEVNNYIVNLEIKDKNGKIDTARTRVSLIDGESAEGTTQVSMGFDLGLDTTLKRFVILTLFALAFAILVMIGGRLLIAGCRLLRPNIQYYRMKVKPKEIDKKVPEKEKKE